MSQTGWSAAGLVNPTLVKVSRGRQLNGAPSGEELLRKLILFLNGFFPLPSEGGGKVDPPPQMAALAMANLVEISTFSLSFSLCFSSSLFQLLQLTHQRQALMIRMPSLDFRGSKKGLLFPPLL